MKSSARMASGSPAQGAQNSITYWSRHPYKS
jgi:hypothetical protein